MKCTVITLYRDWTGETYVQVVEGHITSEQEAEMVRSCQLKADDQVGFQRTEMRPFGPLDALNAFPDETTYDDASAKEMNY